MRKNPLFRLCSTQDDGMSQAIAQEARQIVFEAAKPVRPGQSIASQIDTACKNLGYPRGSWRITAAWYSQAGCWSAAAIAELQHRFLTWREAEASRRGAAENTERARQIAADRASIERFLAHHRAEVAKLAARLAIMTEVDPD